ncbi:hypothetical protein SNK04_002908 [Fusarium graminearum]
MYLETWKGRRRKETACRGSSQGKGVGLSGGGKRVAGEEDVEQADSDGPDVRLGRRVTGAGRIELFRGHVTVAANGHLIRPLLGSCQTKITKLHGTVRSEENVLGLDIAMVDTLEVHVVNGIDELKHELADMLCLERTVTLSDCFVEITLTTKLENEVDMRFGLERVNKVDDVLVSSKATVQGLLF